MDPPLAYFITFSCYGSWLHGDDRGSVDPEHNEFGRPFLLPDPIKREVEEQNRTQPEYILDAERRAIVLATVQEVTNYRKWTLLAVHVRSNHVHLVVSAKPPPERVMNDIKSYASRALNRAGLDTPNRIRWTRHGSTRYLWKPEDVRAAVEYVVRQQGEPMAVFEVDAEVIQSVIGFGT